MDQDRRRSSPTPASSSSSPAPPRSRGTSSSRARPRRRRTTRHRPLVGDDHRHREVHRLRQLRARLQGRERRAARRALLLPHLGRALPRRPASDLEHPRRRLAQRRLRRLPRDLQARRRRKTFFVPKLCNHCAHSPCVQVCPVGATFESPDGVVLVDKSYCLGCRYCVQACPYGCRFIDPRTQHRRQVHALLPPHHQGPDHGLLRGLPDRRAAARSTSRTRRIPIHEFLRTHKVQVLKPHMATGAKVYYNGLDGAVR